MALEVRSLNKKYGKVQALKNVSFKIDTGVYGLLGPNGAGKSTMIRIITGSMRASSGEVLYNGSRIRENEKAYKKILGYVPQRQGMYDSFTAARFLEHMVVLKELKRKEIPEEVERVLKIVGLQEDALRRLGGFSGGMKQRVLIAQALLGDPRIIILDEPTAGLDPKERIKIRNFISRIGENRTILLATHVVSDVESIAREILLLGDGVLKEKGTPSDVADTALSDAWERGDYLKPLSLYYSTLVRRKGEEGARAVLLRKGFRESEIREAVSAAERDACEGEGIDVE